GGGWAAGGALRGSRGGGPAAPPIPRRGSDARRPLAGTSRRCHIGVNLPRLSLERGHPHHHDRLRRAMHAPLPSSVVSVAGLSKTYASGFQALKRVDLDIHRGEIFALLGPNGAGKTTLINIICGIVTPTEATVSVDGHDIITDYRAARSLIGLVPQELHTDAFESVWATVNFSRGLFGKPRNPDYLTKVLKDLSLWEKKDNKIMTLSGGMKRRGLIRREMVHAPRVLLLHRAARRV